MIEPKKGHIILRVNRFILIAWLLIGLVVPSQAQDRPANPLSPLPVPPSQPVKESAGPTNRPASGRPASGRPASGTSSPGAATTGTSGRRIRATGVTGGDTTRLRAGADTTNVPQDQFATTVQYSSKDSSQVNGQVVELWGDAEVVYGEISLKADYIKLNQETNEVYARGRYDSTSKKTVGAPIFKDGPETYNTKEIRYNFKTKKALVTGIVTQQGEGNIRGKTVKKDAEDNLYIRGSIYTTCNLATPHFHINAPKLKVVKNRQVVSGPFNLVLNQIPLPLGLPFGFFPFPKRNEIGTSGIIMPQYGEEPNGRGFYLRDGGYYWAVNEHLGLQFTGQIYSQGSWGLGTSGAYSKRYRYSGGFQLRYNRNFSNEIINPQLQTDFAVNWNHAPQNIGRRSSFSANVNVSSNTYNQFNSFNTAAVTSNGANSGVQYSRQFGKYITSGVNINVNQNFGQIDPFTTLRVNSKTDISTSFNVGVQQIAPFALKGGTGRWYESFRVGFQMNGQLLVNNTVRAQFDTTGFGFKAAVRFAEPISRTRFIRDSIDRATARNQGRVVQDPNLIPFDWRLRQLDSLWDNRQLNLNYVAQIGLPNIKIAQYINLTPSISLQGDVYSSRLNYALSPNRDSVIITRENGFFPTYTFSTGASLNTRVYGTVFIRGKRIEAIRHTFAPQISVAYTPDFSSSFFDFYQTLPAEGVLAGDYFTGNNSFRRTFSRFRGQGGAYGSAPPGQSANIGFSFTNQLEMKVRSRDDSSGQEFKKVPLIDNLGLSGSYNLLAEEFKLSTLSVNGNVRISNDISLNVSTTFDPYSFRTIEREGLPNEYVRDGRVFAFQAGQGLATLTSLQTGFSRRFGPKQSKEPKKSNNASEAQMKAINQNPDLYVDFNIPWSLNVSYNFGFTRFNPEQSAVVMALQLTGDFSLTPKWKFTYQTGYDFQNRLPSITTLGINRDLHCWEMAFNWTPFAGTALRAGNYSFDLRAKSSILQELKLSRRRSFFDAGGFGGGRR